MQTYHFEIRLTGVGKISRHSQGKGVDVELTWVCKGIVNTEYLRTLIFRVCLYFNMMNLTTILKFSQYSDLNKSFCYINFTNSA